MQRPTRNVSPDSRNRSHVMHKTLRILLAVLPILVVSRALAVPSFARQTGLSCNVVTAMHRNSPHWPELQTKGLCPHRHDGEGQGGQFQGPASLSIHSAIRDDPAFQHRLSGQSAFIAKQHCWLSATGQHLFRGRVRVALRRTSAGHLYAYRRPLQHGQHGSSLCQAGEGCWPRSFLRHDPEQQPNR